MNFKLSKLHLALIAAGFGASICGTTYAKTAHGFPVVVPENQAKYFGSVTGLWACPTNDDLYYAVSGSNSSTGSRFFHAVDPDNEFGWRLEAGVLLACSGVDVTANWTHFCGDDDCTAKRAGDDLHARYLPDSDWTSVTGEADFDFDEFNIEVGQKVDFCNVHTRFHFGLSYACLDHEFNTSASGQDSSERQVGRSHLESDFWGIGPRVGVDVTYPLGGPCSPVSLVTHAASSLLCGDIEVDEKGSVAETDSGGSTSVDNFRTRADDVKTVVPAAMLKIGLKYASNTDPATCGYSVEAGYQATGYYHAVSHSLDFDSAHETGIINHISNFSTSGWYLTLAYAG